mgnify:CR=1 FL=1
MDHFSRTVRIALEWLVKGKNFTEVKNNPLDSLGKNLANRRHCLRVLSSTSSDTEYVRIERTHFVDSKVDMTISELRSYIAFILFPGIDKVYTLDEHRII